MKLYAMTTRGAVSINLLRGSLVLQDRGEQAFLAYHSMNTRLVQVKVDCDPRNPYEKGEEKGSHQQPLFRPQARIELCA
jgi:hypothetical protein